jgi:hypothetical protein
VLFFIHLESRRVDIAGITAHPNEPWMQQIARNVTMDGCGILCTRRYLLHDRDTKYSAAFRTIIQSAHIETVRLLIVRNIVLRRPLQGAFAIGGTPEPRVSIFWPFGTWRQPWPSVTVPRLGCCSRSS